ncbi:MAG: FlgD immunoglobulin-like domain containing protein [Candidatus Krumholzibacteriota bacterium]
MPSTHRLPVAILAIICFALPGFPAWASPLFVGPYPYLEAADIPAGFYDGGLPDALEDFEDGTLDWGITCPDGSPIFPGSSTDSVDEDDGVIDGLGQDGRSWFYAIGFYGVTFTFSEPLPTAAGMVWTDGAGLVTFEAFGPGMVSLGTLGPVDIADNEYSGATAEDRFFGVKDPGGILAIKLNNLSGGIEVDHVQFGSADPVSAVPEEVPVCRLGASTPNPFNPMTSIPVTLDEDASQVRLTVYDAAGRLIRTLYSGALQRGTHDIIWNGKDDGGRLSPAGVYLYRLQVGETNLVRRMALIR